MRVDVHPDCAEERATKDYLVHFLVDNEELSTMDTNGQIRSREDDLYPESYRTRLCKLNRVLLVTLHGGSQDDRALQRNGLNRGFRGDDLFGHGRIDHTVKFA